ncbi:MAG: glycosyl transferase family 1 [Bowdeniella nasicola]|nr:glycosyl transferase family 1 [Bowdeniella nasicola]
MATMIYHAPYALQPERATASAIRPIRMLEAFRELGYEVLDITGDAATRERRIRALHARLERGQRIDFLYSESATIPPFMTESHHIPTHPFLDLGLLRTCSRRGIPAGVFYRDLYWKFPEYRERVGQPLATAMTAAYRIELAAYNRWCDTVFLPSERVYPYLSELSRVRLAPLPPGNSLPPVGEAKAQEGPLQILYVGGVGSHYRFHNLVAAVSQTPGVILTICTPQELWEAHAGEYPQAQSPLVRVVHARGEALVDLYRDADICSLAVEPNEYRDFAAPFKFYEYMGYGKPVLSTAGTLNGEIVAAEKIGWVTDNSVAHISSLLAHLRDNRHDVTAVAQRCRQVRLHHSWRARASFVAEHLTDSAAPHTSASSRSQSPLTAPHSAEKCAGEAGKQGQQ